MGVEARLRAVEGRLAAANGLEVQERWVDVASPPVRVRVLESGIGDPVLFLNGIVPEKTVLDAKTLPQIRMPNRDGFTGDPRPDVKSKP